MNDPIHLSTAQRGLLLEPIRPAVVKEDPNGFSYLEAFYVIAHLNQLFGFEGWDKEITSLELVYEDSEERQTRDKSRTYTAWTVCYRCTLRLVIKGQDGYEVTVKEDGATGSAKNQPSRPDAHDLALKDAISSALKRAAKDLGDQFGLSLYNNGSTEAIVRKCLPYGEG